MTEKKVQYENDGTFMYFEISDGPVLQAIKKWEESVTISNERALEFGREIGAIEKNIWKDEYHRICGFSFPTDAVAKGFKHYAADPKGMFRPDSTKEGKAFRERIEQIQPNDLFSVKRMIGPQMVLGAASLRGVLLHSAHWRLYGLIYVAVIPIETGRVYLPPAGLRPLSLSEHFQIKVQWGGGVGC